MSLFSTCRRRAPKKRDGFYSTTIFELLFHLAKMHTIFYSGESMGPVFTTCIGCHNEYGLAREWPWSHDPQTTPNLSWPWQGKIEGETGFIETNLAQLSELVDSALWHHRRFFGAGYDEGIPYILAKPAGLIAPTNADDPEAPLRSRRREDSRTGK